MNPPARERPTPFAARFFGLALLLAWLAIWLCSFTRGQSCLQGWSWLPLWDRLSVDFMGNFLCSRAWVSGADPYQVVFSPVVPVTYGYPPQTLWQFTWCALLPDFRSASIAWFVVSTAIVTAGVWRCLRSRLELGLGPFDPALALALALFSSPIFFELERANCNVLVLLHLLIATAALRRDSIIGDLVAGAAIALASLTKIYPLIAIPALLVLARPRASLYAAICTAAFAAIDLHGFSEFWSHRQATASMHYAGVHGIYDSFMHPLGAWWVLLWRKAGVPIFDWAPQSAIAFALLVPFFAAVSMSILNLAPGTRAKIALPYLLWAVSAGTFLLPIANDYNLLFLPLALLCVFGSPVSWLAMTMLILSLPWLQPFRLPVDPYLMTVLKLSGLAAVAIGLRTRCAAITAKEAL